MQKPPLQDGHLGTHEAAVAYAHAAAAPGGPPHHKHSAYMYEAYLDTVEDDALAKYDQVVSSSAPAGAHVATASAAAEPQHGAVRAEGGGASGGEPVWEGKAARKASKASAASPAQQAAAAKAHARHTAAGLEIYLAQRAQRTGLGRTPQAAQAAPAVAEPAPSATPVARAASGVAPVAKARANAKHWWDKGQ